MWQQRVGIYIGDLTFKFCPPTKMILRVVEQLVSRGGVQAWRVYLLLM